jgi:predicted nucleic acid-binding protein
VRVLIDSCVLMEAERRNFDLEKWALKDDLEIWICDAGIAEFLAGEPVRDGSKRKRFQNFWLHLSALPSLPLTREVCERAGQLLFEARKRGRTVPLGDGLHGAVADIENLQVATTDLGHYADLGVSAFNPLGE